MKLGIESREFTSRFYIFLIFIAGLGVTSVLYAVAKIGAALPAGEQISNLQGAGAPVLLAIFCAFAKIMRDIHWLMMKTMDLEELQSSKGPAAPQKSVVVGNPSTHTGKDSNQKPNQNEKPPPPKIEIVIKEDEVLELELDDDLATRVIHKDEIR